MKNELEWRRAGAISLLGGAHSTLLLSHRSHSQGKSQYLRAQVLEIMKNGISIQIGGEEACEGCLGG